MVVQPPPSFLRHAFGQVILAIIRRFDVERAFGETRFPLGSLAGNESQRCSKP